MTQIKLTQAQIDQIRSDLFDCKTFMNDDEVVSLANRLNKKFNLPFLSEEKELIVFTKIVRLVDSYLYTVLPNEYYSLIRDASDGISPGEAKKIIRRLTRLLNDVIDIPVVPEYVERAIITSLVGFVVAAMVKGFSLDSE